MDQSLGQVLKRSQFQRGFAFVFLFVKYGSFINNIVVTGKVYMQSKTL